VVERRPKVLEDISDNQRDVLEVIPEIRDAANVRDVFAGIRIELKAHSYTVFIDRERLPQIVLAYIFVFLCPRHFGQAPV
jgi:hypothetical protein